jgi:SAM-dependent methyltransferase
VSHGPDTEPPFICIQSGSALRRGADGTFTALDGPARYPSIAGIPILTPHPEGLLSAYLDSLQVGRAAFECHEAEWRELARASNAPKSRRIERMLQGAEQNLALLERCMRPVAEYLGAVGPVQPDVTDLLTTSGAYRTPCWWILPYFLQDWGGTPEFEQVSALLEESLRARPNDGSLAVLGSGAGGLVRLGSRLFQRTYGVDLSITTQLLTQLLFSGEPLPLAVDRADWTTTTIAPPTGFVNPIELLVADVYWLPFADNSMSAVTTQYLLDLLGNPLEVAAEIWRVLEPDGIWVNFSNPFGLPGEPGQLGKPSIEELHEILRPLGFEVIEAKRRQFAWLNVDRLTPFGDRNIQDVHHFVVRKRGAGRARGAARAHSAQRLSVGWDAIPTRTPFKDFSFSRAQVISGAGETREEFRIEVSHMDPLVVDEAQLELFHNLLSLIDGKRSFRQIYDLLTEAGLELEGTSFRRMMAILVRYHAVLRT